MTKTHAVLIAGGGPTGLMLAAELALAKVDVAIVDKRSTQDIESTRAGGLHARSIEVLDQRGIAERFLALGQKAQFASYARNVLDISDFPTRHNYGLALTQAHIERLLAEWVAELQVPCYRGCEVTGFTQDDDGVDVTLTTNGPMRARYLVGCDGGRSFVRKHAGIDFAGWDASVTYLIAEVEMSEKPPVGVHRGAKGVYGVGPLPGGRVRVVLAEERLRQGEEATLQDVKDALVAYFGNDFGVKNPTWVSRFSDMARQAARYRERRVLLAGDAAHVHSPVGGQGLNTGLQDAVNLGWKLAQVVHGTSSDTLLDSYHAERHPVGARALRYTMAHSALDRGDQATLILNAALTDLLKMDGPRKHHAGWASGLDIHYDLGAGHPLLGRRMPDLDIVTASGTQRVYSFLHGGRPLLVNFAAPLTTANERVQYVEARYAGAWELPVVGPVPAPAAVLVRPDGHVAWCGDGSDSGLREALVRWFGRVSEVSP